MSEVRLTSGDKRVELGYLVLLDGHGEGDAELLDQHGAGRVSGGRGGTCTGEPTE